MAKKQPKTDAGQTKSPADPAGNPKNTEKEAPRRCKAHNRSGQQCGRKPTPGREVCRLHGGATPVGLASANFKHGRYSKHLPKDMEAAFFDAVADPDFLSQRSEIAMMTSRIETLLNAAKEQSGGSSESWKELRTVWRDLNKVLRDGVEARKNNNKAETERCDREYQELFRRVGKIIDGAYEADRLVTSALRLLEPRRHLVESERRRIVEQAQVIEISRVAILVELLADGVRKHVRDEIVLAAIGREFTSVLGATPLQPADAGNGEV